MGAQRGRERRPHRTGDLGVNFFDTANAYSAGESEALLGDVLADYDRDEQVVATKVRFPGASDHRNARGLSRKTTEQALSNSLDRLGMDTVDLPASDVAYLAEPYDRLQCTAVSERAPQR